jgi:chloramphenicol-sensitive protein RarD
LSTGTKFALAAYLAWGFLPIYWKALSSVDHVEILAHRVLWSTLFLLALGLKLNGKKIIGLLGAGRAALAPLLLSATLIGVNWFTYIRAVNAGDVLGTALGYFMSPLMNVFLGWLILRERLSPRQWASVGLAALGVALLVSKDAPFPYVSLILASTFGLYGLVRKRVPIEPLIASTIEAALLAPVALAYLATGGHAAGPRSLWIVLGLAFSGVVTALPLLWFAEAAKRLPLSTLGFYQYIAPTFQFLLAVLLYSEPFTPRHVRSFALIWTALAIYCYELLSSNRKAPQPSPAS